ncbi:hypothetical protein [Massilia rhizosphaerae]|uniref:hypothetical protein n=1 Tax=Massilia rhizosphaerae TaxID=2784389 RepID=UPI0018DCE12D|nr:hypothetical protein [Massilia rhizosphaerae]
MKRLLPTSALAWLLAAACAHAAAQTPASGVADPQAPVPDTVARPAIDYRTEPAPAARPDAAWRAGNATVGARNAMSLTMPDHHPGMDMDSKPRHKEGM